MINNFIFYENWLASVKDLKNEEQENKLLRMIVEYGVTGEEYAQADPVTKALFGMIKPQIDNAKMKYAAKVASGGKRKEINEDSISQYAKQGLKAKEIANLLDISIDSVYHSEGWRNRKS